MIGKFVRQLKVGKVVNITLLQYFDADFNGDGGTVRRPV